MDDKLGQGQALFREIYGDEAADGLEAHLASDSSFGSNHARWAMEFPFGMIWPRDGLERKLRSAAVIGMMIAQGAEEELKYHTRMGLKNGLSRVELEEILYSSIPYCGFPASAKAKRIMADVLAEEGL
jgi:4-carboxymuconolactone decarboxylase